MLGRGLLGLPRQPLRALRSLPTARPEPDRAARRQRVPRRAAAHRGDGGVRRRLGVEHGLRRSSRSTTARAAEDELQRPRLPHRRFAFGSLSLDAVKRLKNELGITVNDVVVALCATAVRDWLLDRDELPKEPLVAMIPVSVRTEEQMGTFGNRVSMMIVPIPTNVEDPRERLHARARVPAQRQGAATRRCPPTC